MWPSIRDFVKNFFGNKEYFEHKVEKQIARVRGLVMTVGLVSAFYADKLSATINKPEWSTRIQVVAILLAGASVVLRAGDKTPQEVKDLAKQIQEDKP